MVNHKVKLKEYLNTWRPAKASYNTHGWDGWYVRTYNEDYFGKKPYTEQEAIKVAQELNNGT